MNLGHIDLKKKPDIMTLRTTNCDHLDFFTTYVYNM